MNKINYLIITLLSVFLLLNACIKKEALNKEADILSININEELLKRDPVISNDEVICYVKQNTHLTALAPTFTITEGAHLSPESGTVRDFTTPQIYTVYSEDGQWSKNYTVIFIASDIPKKYHFDHYELKHDAYHELYEEDENGNKNMAWASGNIGFAISANDLPPTGYPASMAEEGFINHSAKLLTCSTGALGEMFGVPLAAGNLFIGEFDLDVSNPLASIHFGLPIYDVPKTLKGYYKYQSGEIFKRYTDENGNSISGGEVINRKDSCAIYAVFYETDENTPYLDGRNVLSHPNIISVAQLTQGNETENWTFFEISFLMKEGKVIDPEKLKYGKYNLTIVFSSSKDGNIYNGAIGSTLLVDEVELVTEEE